MYASKFIPLDPQFLKNIQRELSIQASLKSEFIQAIKEDYFITEEDCKPGVPELVINSELADGNLEDFILNYEGDLQEE